jgi:transposase
LVGRIGGMGQNFIACDREQSLLLPPDLREWLPEGHLAWFVIDAVGELDLGGFYGDYRVDGHGRAAHDPAMMVALVLYAYAVGERSSRRIERRCREDVAFRVIAANEAPDHATIARFRVRHQERLAGLFRQVLGLCGEAGLVSVGVIALDGTKLHAAASGRANRSYEQIAREILEEAAAVDAAEDAEFGDRRGDELPPELAERGSRLERLREAKRKLDEQQALEQAAIDALEVERAQRRAELAKLGRKPRGRPPKRRELPAEPAGRVNVTDPDSKVMRTHRGFIQGYNAQAVTTESQIVIAADLVALSPDAGLLEPMIAQAREELLAAGVEAAPEVVVADAGYWSNEQIDRLAQVGIEALIPPDGRSSTGPQQRRLGGVYDEMRRRLDTDEGRALYRKRQHMIEPVFAQTKVTRGAERFQRRGIAACRAEWRLITATHNLLKLWRAGLAPHPTG